MRKLAIGGALAATLAACWFAPDDDTDMIAPAQARTIVGTMPAVSAPADPAPPDALPDIRKRLEDEDLGNAFARQSWQADGAVPDGPAPADSTITKPVAAKAGPVTPPGPPALPIRVLGRFIDDGKQAWFLEVEDRNVVAYVGDKIDDNYTFDSAAGDALTFTYLPLKQKQVIAVRGMN